MATPAPKKAPPAASAPAPAHELDALRFPLHGSRLIEASAGTGKTWTIAALYLRLVLGHDRRKGAGAEATAFHRPLLPAEILVMTFTRAATKELSDRIRARLIEAARCFRGDDTPAVHDTLLADLLADYPEPAERTQAAWRLAMAAEAMDDAAVFTIDAWCQRMLREHAFDSGNPFDEELAADERSLLVDAAQDYWRQQCYPLSGDRLDFVLNLWPDVHALHEEVRELVGQPLQTEDLEEALGECIGRVMEKRREALGTLSTGWVKNAPAMKAWIDEELAPKACDWDRRKLQSRYYSGWFDALAVWANDPLGQTLELSPSARHRLSPEGMLEARKPDAPALALPKQFKALAALFAAYDALPDPNVAIRIHAATRVARRLSVLKRQARSFGFADMLERLDQALSGPHGSRLRERILTQYPVALIDEFQDTSPLQYRLFDALYRTAHNDPRTALLLIGDPKQSIYGFRGADIYSYLQARRATTGRHYVLGTNYRSTEPLVEAVNHWFERAENQVEVQVPELPDADDGAPPGGAFLFRTGTTNDLPFGRVGANGRQEVFHTLAGPVPAVSIHHDLELRSATVVRRLFAARCAEQIVAWLNDGKAGFRQGEDLFKRLRPADIAVLVRTGKEAAAVRRELRKRGVASVYLSDKDSVFASDEARDLLHWLRAVAAPRDAQRVRAGLATQSVGLTIEELAWLASDDEAFDRRSEEVHQLHGVWRDRGVLAMLRRTLHLLDLPARWLSEPEGERRLTNFLHLAELLQQASAQLDGENALIRWLAMQIEEGAAGSDEQVVRLESDADLVKVVTVHKSKGLEYPVVCLPFACSFRRVERRYARFLKLADASGTREIKLDYSEADLERAERDRLREDLRLFYVALTRARHALWMGFAALKIGNGKDCVNHRSAPGYLLAGLTQQPAAFWLTPLTALAERANEAHRPDAGTGACIRLEAADEAIGFTSLQRRTVLSTLQDSPVYASDFERRWSIGSFSALVRDLDAASAQAKPLAPTQIHSPADDEGLDEASPLSVITRSNRAPWHRFPGGRLVGNFLHDQLEWLAEEGFALEGDEPREALLRRRCERAGHGDHADDAVLWMKALVASPLPSLGVSLRALDTRLPELEFWMPSAHLRAGDVDALCRRHLLDGHPRPDLPQRELHGMLMGFADLVFEHEGRFWVLDYKSNRLGEAGAAYDHAALEAEMAHHRYDVQAAIYLLALHRLLRVRLGATYDPARQLGGALYFFLRGIDGLQKGEYLIAATPEVRALIDTLDTLLTDEASLA